MRHARPAQPLGIASLLGDVLDLVHPRGCAGCGAWGYDLCPDCLAVLTCSPFVHRPQPLPPRCPLVYAAAAYDGVVRQVILAWKERKHRTMAMMLGGMLADAVAAGARAHQISGSLLLVPIPASRDALRHRGEDVLLRVARVSAMELRRMGWEAVVHPVLTLDRTPRDQAGLDADARRANLHDVMRVKGTGQPDRGGVAVPPGQPDRGGVAVPPGQTGAIVIVDDIVTTGVTLAEAARALAQADHPEVFAATIAATARRSHLR